jgi:hemerythrin
MVDTLYAGCFQDNSETARKFFERNIYDMLDYIQYHFSTEEKLLYFINYPRYAEHKQQHSEFMRKMAAAVKSLDTKKQFFFRPCVQYLKDWLLIHITASDKEYGLFLRIMKKRAYRKNKAAQV